jgi:ABC-type Mn2+/Zn2+ transport system permease subunit/Mn-dependent DtxR family transcriptional regulator
MAGEWSTRGLTLLSGPHGCVLAASLGGGWGDLWSESARYDTLCTLALSLFVSLSCSWLGCFLILQGQALLGDALSHTVLLGLVLAALWTGGLGSGTLLLAAVITALVTSLMIQVVSRTSRVKEDAATGIVFTSLFALGVVLLSSVAPRLHLDAQHALYGNLEFVAVGEKLSVMGFSIPIAVCQMGFVCLVLFGFLLTCYRPLLVAGFDPQLARSMGLSVHLVQGGLLAALSTTVVGAFSSVGAILVVGLLIAPPATGFLLSRRLPGMLFWSSLSGVLAAVVGLHLAYWLDVTTAATMVVVACALFGLAFLWAPESGVFWKVLRRGRLRLRMGQENLVRLLLRMQCRSTDSTPSPHELCVELGCSRLSLSLWLAQLRWRGWIAGGAARGVMLTPCGVEEAQRLDRAHRLWEAYLVQHVGLPIDHVHPSAEELEHLLDEPLLARLDDALGHPETDPHGAEIPRIPRNPDQPGRFPLSQLRVGDRGCLVGLETATDQPQDGPNPNWVAQLAELQLELGGGLRVVDRNSEQETWTVQFANGRQNVIPHRLADLLIVELDV